MQMRTHVQLSQIGFAIYHFRCAVVGLIHAVHYHAAGRRSQLWHGNWTEVVRRFYHEGVRSFILDTTFDSRLMGFDRSRARL